MRSFTPTYEGDLLVVEIGVLHPGEPYTGSGGFMYSAEPHAVAAGTPWLELEIRQDLLVDDQHHREFIDIILRALQLTGFA